jgi:amidohydrolase
MAISIEELKKKACIDIDALAEEMRCIAGFIGAHPEMGYQEHEASRALMEFLVQYGLEVEAGIAGMPTAFRGIYRKAPGPVVVLLAEYDALPEIGHGCGHNISGVAAAAAGIAVAKQMTRGAIQVLGSPAEEGNVPDAGGKIRLIENGYLNGVDAALSTHAGGVHLLKMDIIARMSIEMEFYGKGAHAALAPDQGINALDAAVLTINGINALRQHIKRDILIHGYMTDGGTMINTIPEFARLRYGIRAQSGAALEQILERVLNCGRGGALATGCRFEWRHVARTYNNLIHNEPMLAAFTANMDLLGETVIKYLPLSASTDMGNVSHVVPTIHPFIGLGNPDLLVHTKAFAEASCTEPGFNSMILAAKVMAMTCLDLLHDKELLAKTKDDFEKRKNKNNRDGC